jgi:hypothetical protein
MQYIDVTSYLIISGLYTSEFSIHKNTLIDLFSNHILFILYLSFSFDLLSWTLPRDNMFLHSLDVFNMLHFT